MSEYEEELFEAETEVTEPEAEATPEPEAKEPETEAETTGEKESDSTPEPGKPAAVKEEEGSVPRQALLDERRKRQEAEEKLRAFESSRKEEPTPDPIDDPDGYTKRLEQKWQQQNLQTRVDMSRELMSALHEDYPQREAEFEKMMQEDHSLAQKAAAASNPTKFAYEYVIKAEKAKRLDNIDEYESQVRTELEAKIRAEMEKKYDKEKSNLDSVTPSLAKQSSKGSLNGASWTGPTPIEDILPT